MQNRALIISRHFSSTISLTEKLLQLIPKCSSTKSLLQIQTQMLINSIHKPNFLLSKLILLKDYRNSVLLFSRIINPNDYAFNIMIRGLTTTWNEHRKTIDLYCQMKCRGVRTNNFTYPFVFVSCGYLMDLNYGRIGHSDALKIGLGLDSHVNNSLITFYAKSRELACARKVFDEFSDRDLVSWNAMINGYWKMGYSREAVDLCGKMMDEGVEGDEMTVVSVLGACGELGDLELGRWVEEFVIGKEVELSSYVGSALIGMFGKCGDLVSARRVFDGMETKDVVIWNSMITGYAQNGLSKEAIDLFNCMKVETVNPDKITLIGVLSACSSIGALEFGKWVDEYASERGLKFDIYVATALIDMFAKCGSLDEALRVFEDMPYKNDVSWNAMISALAFHGQAHKALSLFYRMSREGEHVRPNDITFVGILSACVHAGLVDEGHRLFYLMTSLFGLVPKIEHYSCMVDLLARAGRVQEAWDFIQMMPEKPDEVVLGALLGACKKAKDIDVSERVIELLLDMEPSNSGNYVISSKIYSNVKRLGDSAKMRVLMKQKGIMKTPGCSWIEIENNLHEFHAGDGLHCHAIELQQAFELLIEELMAEGYSPKLECE